MWSSESETFLHINSLLPRPFTSAIVAVVVVVLVMPPAGLVGGVLLLYGSCLLLLLLLPEALTYRGRLLFNQATALIPDTN